MADPRDARIAKLEADLHASQERERQFGEIIAQQQTLIAAQQKLIADLQRRLAEQDAEQAGRAAHFQAEIERLERQLLGPKTERTKVPPMDRELRDDPSEMTPEQLAARRAEIARKRRERAIAKSVRAYSTSRHRKGWFSVGRYLMACDPFPSLTRYSLTRSGRPRRSISSDRKHCAIPSRWLRRQQSLRPSDARGVGRW